MAPVRQLYLRTRLVTFSAPSVHTMITRSGRGLRRRPVFGRNRNIPFVPVNIAPGPHAPAMPAAEAPFIRAAACSPGQAAEVLPEGVDEHPPLDRTPSDFGSVPSSDIPEDGEDVDPYLIDPEPDAQVDELCELLHSLSLEDPILEINVPAFAEFLQQHDFRGPWFAVVDQVLTFHQAVALLWLLVTTMEE